MRKQDYKSHIQLPAGIHYVLGVCVLTLIGAFVNTYKSYVTGTALYSASLILILAILLIITLIYARISALKTQDRAIRAEENFRYYLMTGKPLPVELKIRQIIGLRFSSDDEFIPLIERALKDNLSEKEIKQSIKNWKGDYYRI